MKLLILGGTVFLGRHLVMAAQARGHEVTIFNRGVHGPDLFPEVEHLQGDRSTNDLAALQGRQWDAVIDTNGYAPGKVRTSARLLSSAVRHYTFISTISVYADFSTPGMDESAPLSTMTPEELQATEQVKSPESGTVARIYGEHYGALKALCEQALVETFTGASLVVRPGLIVGPYDQSDRFTYWPRRIAAGGEVLAPGRPERPIQLIDARDLAEWIIRLSEQGQTGTYNATGPDYRLSMQQVLEMSKQTTGSDAAFLWLDDAFLLTHGATPWSQIPLWLPDETSNAGFSEVDVSRALAAGLTFRPLTETIRDTLAWDATRSTDTTYAAGLPTDQETRLLQAWRQR